MVTMDQLAEAALRRDGLGLRALAQGLVREHAALCDVPRPQSSDPRVQITAAALIELLAYRQSQAPPSWTQPARALDKPFFLLESVTRMPRLRAQCEAESPAPLRQRNIFAPRDFLTFA